MEFIILIILVLLLLGAVPIWRYSGLLGLLMLVLIVLLLAGLIAT